MSASSQRLRALRRLPWLAELSESELEPLAGACRERNVRSGAPLVHPDEPARVHVVMEGSVAAHGFPSPAIGLVEVLARDGGVSAVAGTDALVLELSAAHAKGALQDSFPLLLAIVRGLARATLERGMPPVFPLVAGLPCNDCVDLVAKTFHARRARPASIQMGEIHLAAGSDLWREGDASGYG